MTSISRRRFLKLGGAAIASAAGIGLYAWQIEPHWVEVVRRAMPLENLPPGLEGRTLLHVSDIHVGPRVSSRYLIQTFERAHDLAPDFVAYSGDFVTYRSPAVYAELASVLRHAPNGRLGTVASFGNHDYGFRWRQLAVADQLTHVAANAGIRVLRNEVEPIAGLQFAGLADYWSPEFGAYGTQSWWADGMPAGSDEPGTPSVRMGARETVARLTRGLPTVVLSHNPDVQDEPIWEGMRGWVLAGHTHGGQVKPPFLPPPVLPVRNKRYTSGAFEIVPGRSLYINRGLGHLTQVRFNVRPELTLFTLTRAR